MALFECQRRYFFPFPFKSMLQDVFLFVVVLLYYGECSPIIINSSSITFNKIKKIFF